MMLAEWGSAPSIIGDIQSLRVLIGFSLKCDQLTVQASPPIILQQSHEPGVWVDLP
jgi:hypothetical protein